MRHFPSVHLRFFQKPTGWLLSLFLGLGLTLGAGTVLRAESPETAPVELKALISQIDAAATRQDLPQVMAFYSSEFTDADGLNYTTLSQALSLLWNRYPSLQYTTELLSWKKEGDLLVAETLTKITGTSKKSIRTVQLNSAIKSRQYFQNQKLVRQEILTERTELMAGSNPPKIEVTLPETIRVGQEFDFDVIVLDPIGDSLLAGTAIEEKIESDRYLNPADLELKLLQAGGIFKRAKAPDTPSNRWLSAIIVRDDGITLVTQRLRIEK
jgi:ketosteroid isomerase-like protein